MRLLTHVTCLKCCPPAASAEIAQVITAFWLHIVPSTSSCSVMHLLLVPEHLWAFPWGGNARLWVLMLHLLLCDRSQQLVLQGGAIGIFSRGGEGGGGSAFFFYFLL